MPDKTEPETAPPQLNAASPDKLEDAVWRLKISGGGGGGDGRNGPLPERPGEADCVYYLRTGACGYGSSCRYNHPTGQGGQRRGDAADRVSQPDCQYFLRTGTCKFGANCKYHHPQVKHDSRLVSVNIMGLPIRQDEKSCPYYMRNGSCKFGIACKFNHPQPATLGSAYPVTGPVTYGSTGSSMAPPSGLIGGFPPWPLARNPYMSSPGVPGLPTYMPVILPPSQGITPMQQGWGTYTSNGTTQMSSSKNPAQPGSTISVNLPQRPDQPECQFFIKTGSCKFGANCKYHHPQEKNPLVMCTLGPLGLPLRPGQAMCSFYSMYGVCKYGSACKYDHPIMGYYNYSIAAVPVSDTSAFYVSQTSYHHVTETSLETLPAKTKAGDGRIESEPAKTKAGDGRIESEDRNGVSNGDSKEQGDREETTSLSHNSPSSESLGDHSE